MVLKCLHYILSLHLVELLQVNIVGSVGLHVGQDGRERNVMCLGLVNQLTRAEISSGRTSTTIRGGTWEGENAWPKFSSSAPTPMATMSFLNSCCSADV